MFRQRGFITFLPVLLIVLGVGGLVVFYQSKFKDSSFPIASKPPMVEASPSATILPTPLPTSPLPSKYVAETFDCNLTSSAERVPPPSTFYFTATPTKNLGNVSLVQWDINSDGIVDATSPTLEYSHTFKEAGDYNVKARVKLSNGAISNWCSKKVEARYHDVKCNIYPSPTSGKAPLLVYLNTGVYSDAVLDEEGIESQQWDFDGDGNWDTSFNEEHKSLSYTFNQPKNYTVRMQVKTKSGRLSPVCTASVNVTN